MRNRSQIFARRRIGEGIRIGQEFCARRRSHSLTTLARYFGLLPEIYLRLSILSRTLSRAFPAGDERIELPTSVLETEVIPLN